jgi:deoxyribodipyrimidine photo-lyase
MNKILTIFWFRRDLRLFDNKGLHYALKENTSILPVFIFDASILNKLETPNDQRVNFIYQTVQDLKSRLEKMNSTIMVLYGEPLELFSSLIQQYKIKNLYLNRDYEPYTVERDRKIRELFEKNNIEVKEYKDQVIFERDEIVKDNGDPYSVFTPYMNRWKNAFSLHETHEFPIDTHLDNFYTGKPFPMPSMQEIGFQASNFSFPGREIDKTVLSNYGENRDYPFLNATSRLGVHLRFGTISIRQTVQKAGQINTVWFDQLIWREFFMMILWHHPRIVDQSFKEKYDFIDWRNDEKEFQAWCDGRTGYPFVDAGMRQLNETGYMHNRVRMITASFLTKHLLIDWRWGEAYFAQKLLDYELASNNGGWQWAAGSGCDAAPYFRIFNPQRQVKRFDPEMKYIRKWIKEYDTDAYPKPIVDHKFARERALKEYKKALNQQNI